MSDNDTAARREQQVRDLFGAFEAGSEAGCAQVRKLFADGCTWMNPGMPTTTGPDEAIATIERFEEEAGVHSTEMKIVNLAVAGDVVLVEHHDRARGKDGALMVELAAVAVMRFEGDQLVAWREYFDPGSIG